MPAISLRIKHSILVLEAQKQMLIPIPGVEPGPPGWKPGILTARPYGTTRTKRKAANRVPLSALKHWRVYYFTKKNYNEISQIFLFVIFLIHIFTYLSSFVSFTLSTLRSFSITRLGELFNALRFRLRRKYSSVYVSARVYVARLVK